MGSPDQPRDEKGMWTDGGGSGGKGSGHNDKQHKGIDHLVKAAAGTVFEKGVKVPSAATPTNVMKSHGTLVKQAVKQAIAGVKPGDWSAIENAKWAATAAVEKAIKNQKDLPNRFNVARTASDIVSKSIADATAPKIDSRVKQAMKAAGHTTLPGYLQTASTADQLKILRSQAKR